MKMKKTYAALAALALVSSISFAAPLTGVAGYDPATAGSTITLSATPVRDNAYTVKLGGVIGVSFEDLKGMKPIRTVTDQPTKKAVSLYTLPDGTTIYAMGLGREWGEMTEEIKGIDLAKAKASGKIANGAVSLDFKKGDERCRVVTWVAVLPDGQRVWGGHPEGGWSTKNVNGSPMTGWCFAKDGAVVKMDQATKTALAAKK